jgi:hypothetical protein
VTSPAHNTSTHDPLAAKLNNASECAVRSRSSGGYIWYMTASASVALLVAKMTFVRQKLTRKGQRAHSTYVSPNICVWDVLFQLRHAAPNLPARQPLLAAEGKHATS